MSQNFVYPASSQVTVSGIGTPNNAVIPSSSVLVAGENPSGFQTVVQTDSLGNLIVSPLTTSSTVTVVQPTGTNLHAVIDSSALPTGASTASLQTSGNTSLSTIATNTTGVSTAANQTTGNASLSTIATNTTGASTAALQTSGNASLTTIATNSSATQGTVAAGTAASKADLVGAVFNTALPTLTTGQQAALQADSSGRLIIAPSSSTSTVTVVQPTAANLNATIVQATAANLNATIVGTVTANQGTANATPWNANISQYGGTATTLGSKVSASSIPVVIASDQAAVSSKAATPTALTITQAAVTVGTTAVRLTPTGSAPSATRVLLVATPDAASTAKFYIGSSTVTATGATRGIQIVAGQAFIANSDAGDYFIISDTAAQTVEIMAQG